MKYVLSILAVAAPITFLLMPDHENPAPAPAGRDWKAFATEHYKNMSRMLAAKTPAGMTEEQAERRAALSLELLAYGQRGVFTKNTDHPDRLYPYFIDKTGNLCAVANLMNATGDLAIAKNVANIQNHAFVAELTNIPEIQDWLFINGVTAEEAARIQAPAGGWKDFGPGGSIENWAPKATKPPGPPPVYSGPGEAGPRSTAPKPSGPSTPVAGPALTPTPRGVYTDDTPPAWATWWDYNKLEFLQNAGRDFEKQQIPFDDTGVAPAAVPERGFVILSLEKLLNNPNALVRASAALSYARAGGKDTTHKIVPLLSDPNYLVRFHAILALGATGDGAAAGLLTRIAVDGKLQNQAELIAPFARSVATVALSVGRARGFSGTVDPIARWQWLSPEPSDKLNTHIAALLYQTLTPWDQLESDVARDIVSVEDNINIRARALEALGANRASVGLPMIYQALSDSNVQLRRSAALALCSYSRLETVPRIQNALDLEKDDYARGALLIALARIGGDAAKGKINDELKNGPARMRPWSALAAGIFSRIHKDSSAVPELLRIGKEGKVMADREAVALALGLSRASESVNLLNDWLQNSKSAELRSRAAVGLALLGDPSSAVPLRAALAREKSPKTLSEIALALSTCAAKGDIVNITDALSGTHGSQPNAYLSVAATMRDSLPYAATLQNIAADEKAPAASRSIAILALGAVADRNPRFLLAKLIKNSNFELSNDWQSWLAITPL